LGKELGIEFEIPPGAVPEGKGLNLSVWPCSAGPFQLPEGYDFASPVFLISPSFEFSCEITLKLYHFSSVLSAEDCKKMVFLSSPATHALTREETQKPVYQFRRLGKGVFEPLQEFGEVALSHFCFTAVGRTSDASKNIYSYGVFREKEFGDMAIFSAFPNVPLLFRELESYMEIKFPQLYSLAVEIITIEGEKIGLQWPKDTGWIITPDRIPCELSKTVLDFHEMIPHPPMMRLDVERVHSSNSRSPIEVSIVGIREEKKFILNPKTRPSVLFLCRQQNMYLCL
jgi:hypothetical protein